MTEESKPCPAPFAFIVSCVRSPSASIAPFWKPTPWSSGWRRTDSPAKVHHIDARVGGTYKMSFRNFTTGTSHSFGGKYLELVPNERIRHTDLFDDANLPGEMQVTITIKPVLVGVELNIVQEGIPDVIPVEACYLGWQESLTLLAQLVEPEIPDQG